jgi:hypothetical protein
MIALRQSATFNDRPRQRFRGSWLRTVGAALIQTLLLVAASGREPVVRRNASYSSIATAREFLIARVATAT